MKFPLSSSGEVQEILQLATTRRIIVPRRSNAAAMEATVKINLQDAKKCVSRMNEARHAADFPNLSEGTLFSTNPDKDPSLQSVCRALLEESGAYSNLGVEELSFVALYNPSDKAQGDCRVVLREQQPASQQAPSGSHKENTQVEWGIPGGEDEDEDDEKHGGEPGSRPDVPPSHITGGKTVSALVCLTSPDALANEPLFT
ncbi:hypothetical protein ACSSS7_003168 [Eimeria intestinalis]